MNRRTLGSILGLIIVIIVFALITTPRQETKETTNTETTVVKATLEETTVEDTQEEVKDYLRSDIPLTEDEQTWLYEACITNGCPYDIALSVMYVETKFRNVMGDDGKAYGYFQIHKRWVTDLMKELGVTDLMDAKSNFLVGTKLLGDYIKEYGVVDGLTKYNTGHTGHSLYTDKVFRAKGILYEDD